MLMKKKKLKETEDATLAWAGSQVGRMGGDVRTNETSSPQNSSFLPNPWGTHFGIRIGPDRPALPLDDDTIIMLMAMMVPQPICIWSQSFLVKRRKERLDVAVSGSWIVKDVWSPCKES